MDYPEYTITSDKGFYSEVMNAVHHISALELNHLGDTYPSRIFLIVCVSYRRLVYINFAIFCWGLLARSGDGILGRRRHLRTAGEPVEEVESVQGIGNRFAHRRFAGCQQVAVIVYNSDDHTPHRGDIYRCEFKQLR